MQVVAKFKVNAITKTVWVNSNPPEYAHTIVAYPVSGGVFGKATPSGKLEMTIVNDQAAKQFEVGKEYLVTFSEDTSKPE